MDPARVFRDTMFDPIVPGGLYWYVSSLNVTNFSIFLPFNLTWFEFWLQFV